MSYKIISGTNHKLIISFSGQGKGMGTLPQFEFVNFLEKNFHSFEKHFYLDMYNKWYHKGIEGISKNIKETTEYLREKIKGFEEVIFIGSSAGGYAAILFGSLLKVDKVIAFKPQTIVDILSDMNSDYRNINKFIQPHTKYFIYGDLSVDIEKDPLHHYSHCENIELFPNVIIDTSHDVDLKKWRDKGILKKKMESVIYSGEHYK
jgi:hypothetical protein